MYCFNKSEESKECMICHYWYFKDGFKYQPHVCNACHYFSMNVQNLSDFFVVTIKNVDYKVYITGVDKKAAVFFLNNSDLMDFNPNISPVEIIKKGASGGTYFRDIYSGVKERI